MARKQHRIDIFIIAFFYMDEVTEYYIGDITTPERRAKAFRAEPKEGRGGKADVRCWMLDDKCHYIVYKQTCDEVGYRLLRINRSSKLKKLVSRSFHYRVSFPVKSGQVREV